MKSTLAFKRLLTCLLIATFSGLIVVFMCGCYWIFNPLDQQAWRVRLHLPILGDLHVRAYPLLQLATSAPGKRLLNGTRWQSTHGMLVFHNDDGLVRVICEQCSMRIAELSPQPLQFDSVMLTLRGSNQELSGLVDLQNADNHLRLFYVAHIDMQGVNLGWSLPNTALTSLLMPLKTHSVVLQKAQVSGSLAATGTLQWPSRKWSAKPSLSGFEVAGLGTEKLRYGVLKYRCHGSKQTRPQSYTWVSEKNMGRWLPKAVLIAEDIHFTVHPGYDMDKLSYLLSAEHHGTQFGGSTITQQLAKNFFTGGERNWVRKLEELLYAVEMERTLGKRRIFDLYLNTVDWGPGICGAEQAARIYFARSPGQLSAVQAAWLAGAIRNPHLAWQHEYQSQQPDMKRLEWVLGYMPRKARNQPRVLQFTMCKKESQTVLQYPSVGDAAL